MTLTANGQGQITGQFTIPANVPAGTKLVTFQGAATPAYATFVGRGVLKIEDLRTVTATINRRLLTWAGDPLAQTFTLPPPAEGQTYQIAALDLWFTAIGSTNILVQLRDTSLGLPTLDVLAESLLTPDDITLNGWTRFFFTPTALEPDHEYALVIACNDPVAAVALAELGQFDTNAQRWMTSQPYQIGVLLSSSNNRTWTAHQTRDLTFRLLACQYAATTRTITLDPVAVTDADHLIVLATVERPTADCDVVFNLTVDAEVYTVIENQPFTLPERYTGTVTWEAVLIGATNASPVLHTDIQLIVGTRQTSSDYISRAMPTNVGNGTVTLTLYYDVLLSGAASVAAAAQNGVDGNDDPVWLAMPIIEGTPLGDGWTEVKCAVADFTEVETRIKLTLSGSAQALPHVKNLRAAIT